MKCVWSSDGYMLENPDCGMIEGDSEFDIIVQVLGMKDCLVDFIADCFEIELKEDREISKALQKKIIKQLKSDNGDGKPYFTIKNENGKVIFGG